MKDRIYLPLIAGVSLLIPMVVAVLLYVPGKLDLGFNSRILPLVNALINSTVSALLIAGFVLIRQKRWLAHRNVMLAALGFSVLFLLSYVVYHASVPSTPYCGVGAIRPIYFFILVTHIVLAAVIVPMALFSVYRGLSQQIDQHRRIARLTLPIWLYVSVTGVVVYLMLRPCYVG